MGDDNLEKKI